MTVAQLAAALAKCDPKALVLWNGNYSCVAHALEPRIKRASVSKIGNETYSLLGPPESRDLPAVLIDVMDPP